MTVILVGTARRARRTQREHDAQEGTSRCKGCWAEGLGSILAGTCRPYTDAEAILVRYDQQRVARSRPPATGRVPVGQLWVRR